MICDLFSQLLGFMLGWLTFYHTGHEVAKDFKPYFNDLQFRVQKVVSTSIRSRVWSEVLKILLSSFDLFTQAIVL